MEKYRLPNNNGYRSRRGAELASISLHGPAAVLGQTEVKLGASHLKASRSADPVRCRSEVQTGANQPAGRCSYARLSLGPFSAIRINWA